MTPYNISNPAHPMGSRNLSCPANDPKTLYINKPSIFQSSQFCRIRPLRTIRSLRSTEFLFCYFIYYTIFAGEKFNRSYHTNIFNSDTKITCIELRPITTKSIPPDPIYTIIPAMKHCLSCYRMLPNAAKSCHYCGAEQANKTAFPGKQIQRCPACLSYLYSSKSGCQTCGYVPDARTPVGTIITVFSLLLAGIFILWQLGFIPQIPYGGKAARRIQIESNSAAQIIPTIPKEDNPETSPQPSATETMTETEASLLRLETETPQPTPTIAVTDTPQPIQCGNLTNRLREGQYGKIISGGRSSKIRSLPSLSSETLATFNANKEFIVLADAPVCEEGYLWIRVRILADQYEGWTVEADAENYWLIEKDVTPIPPANE